MSTEAEKPVKAPSSKSATAVQRQNKTSIDDPKPGAAQKRKTNVVGFVFNLLLLGGLGYLAFMFFEQGKTFDVVFSQQNQFAIDNATTTTDLLALQSQAQQLDTLLAAATSRIDAQDLRLTEARNIIAVQSSELENLNRELVRTRLKINDSGTAVNQEWLLAEVESLLRLAQQGLIVTGDVRAAIALFIASDDILKQINDPAIFSIRDTLARELRVLRAVPEINIQELYLELGELGDRVETLQVISGGEGRLDSAQELVQNPENGQDEAGIIDAVLTKLSEYIVLSRSDEAIQPLFTSEQRLYVMQNIQLQIQQARLSLLREQEEVFTSSLEDAIENIESYLTGSSLDKQSILRDLKTLHDGDIITRVPSVTSTLNALRTIIPESNGQGIEPQAIILPVIEVNGLSEETENTDANERPGSEQL